MELLCDLNQNPNQKSFYYLPESIKVSKIDHPSQKSYPLQRSNYGNFKGFKGR